MNIYILITSPIPHERHGGGYPNLNNMHGGVSSWNL